MIIKRSVPHYGFTLHLTDSAASAKRIAQKEFQAGDQIDKDYQGGLVLTDIEKKISVLLVTTKTLSTLCHECVHFAHDVADSIGGNPLGDSEPYAYLADYAFTQFLEYIWNIEDKQ